MDVDRTSMMGSSQPAAISAEEPCPSCQTTIPPGDEFCPKCGYQRGTWQGAGAASTAAGAAPAPAAAMPDATGPALWTLTADGQSWPLSAGTHALGRGEVDVRIDDSYASRRHAQIEVTADKVVLTDLGSSNGTFVDDRRLEPNAPEEIVDGGSFRVANTALTLQRAEATADATVVAAAEADWAEVAEPEQGIKTMDTDGKGVLHTDPEGTTIDDDAQLDAAHQPQEPAEPSTSHWELQRADGEIIRVGFGELTLGRKEAAADHVIEGDSYISGCHCRLIATQDRLEITDLHSTNGTFVNDARLDPEQPWKLESGDKLRVGQTVFEVNNNKPALTEGQELEQIEPSE